MRADFEREQEQDRFENGHSYSGGIGMANGLRILQAPMFTRDKDADEWLADNCEKWEAAKAVPVFGSGGGIHHYRIGAWCSC
jgi:hypothetical protein